MLFMDDIPSGKWREIPQPTLAKPSSLGNSFGNTVSFDFPGGQMGIAVIGIFVAGIIVGYLLSRANKK